MTEGKVKNIRYKESKTVIDKTTGEVLAEEKITKVVLQTEPDFVKLYLKDIARLKDLPPAADNVLWEILNNLQYGNIFPAYGPVKKFMCRNLNMKMNTINKCIDNLYKKGILIRVERGMYLVDPNLFAKGKWEDIKNLRLVVDYDPETGERKLSSNAPNELKQLKMSFGEEKNPL